MTNTGKVYLVGAGPGAPDLITVRGRECLARAEAIVYDTLTHPDLLKHGPGAEHIYVGKKTGRHTLPQEEINRILVDQARQGRIVARLKGGDPFVFGRGGEEALALAEAGVPFEVVPGVTAGIAAPAYAGVPVTHRGISTGVAFFTAHTARDERPLDLERIAQRDTLVFYMGVGGLPGIVAELRRLGRSGETPAAVIEWATYARQRTVTAPLDSIAERSRAAGIEAPAIVVVGDVVAFRERMSWFEARPLFGLRIAVTHTRRREGRLEQRLRDLGAELFVFPTLEIAPAESAEGLGAVSGYDWIVFSSPNGAEVLFEFLDHHGQDARALAGVRLCAVGSATQEALARRFLRVDAAPEGYGPEAVRDALAARGPVEGVRVLHPRADIARRSYKQVLEAAGAVVAEPVAYTARPAAESRDRLEALLAFKPDVVTLTNSAAARQFAALLGEEAVAQFKEQAVFASLGPVTTQAAAGHGIPVTIEPERHDVVHLVEAICQWRARER